MRLRPFFRPVLTIPRRRSESVVSMSRPSCSMWRSEDRFMDGAGRAGAHRRPERADIPDGSHLRGRVRQAEQRRWADRVEPSTGRPGDDDQCSPPFPHSIRLSSARRTGCECTSLDRCRALRRRRQSCGRPSPARQPWTDSTDDAIPARRTIQACCASRNERVSGVCARIEQARRTTGPTTASIDRRLRGVGGGTRTHRRAAERIRNRQATVRYSSGGRAHDGRGPSVAPARDAAVHDGPASGHRQDGVDRELRLRPELDARSDAAGLASESCGGAGRSRRAVHIYGIAGTTRAEARVHEDFGRGPGHRPRRAADTGLAVTARGQARDQDGQRSAGPRTARYEPPRTARADFMESLLLGNLPPWKKETSQAAPELPVNEDADQ
jgi:hypothetical protein